MSSRLRYVLSYGGGWYAGHNVFRVLRQRLETNFVTAPYLEKLTELPDIVKAAEAIKGKIWIFREPRSVKGSKSRYKTFCRTMQINLPRVPMFNPPLEVAYNGRAHQQPRPARARREPAFREFLIP